LSGFDTGLELDMAFSGICQDDRSAFKRQMLDIERTCGSSLGDQEEWNGKLRFLDISRFHPGREPRELQLTVRGNPREPYLAVSYTWESTAVTGTAEPRQNYYIRRPQGRSGSVSEVDPRVYDRAIAFAEHIDITSLWVDQDSIPQKEFRFPGQEDEKAVAIQHMHEVYRNCSASVGLLAVQIQSTEQVEGPDSLLSGALFRMHTDGARFDNARVTEDLLSYVDHAIALILSDQRWGRVWIFSEDFHAASKMTLLVPCVGCAKVPEKFHDMLGNLPGELRINALTLKEACTKFQMACIAAQRPVDDRLFSKVRMYKLWRPHTATFAGRRTTLEMFHSPVPNVLHDIEGRDGCDAAKKLTMLANCCGYSFRLGAGRLARRKHEKSACLLTLLLRNGELFLNSSDEASRLRAETTGITGFLQNHLLFTDPPGKSF